MAADHASIEEQTEGSPLLPSGRSHTSGDIFPKTKSSRSIVLFITLTFFLLNMGGGLILIPQQRLVEDVLCREYWRGRGRGNQTSIGPLDSIEEKYCKADEIQSELAYILGIQATLEFLPGTLPHYVWKLWESNIISTRLDSCVSIWITC